MRKNHFLKLTISLFAIGSVLLTACQSGQLFGSNTTTIPSGEAVPDGPVLITGELEYPNEVVEIYYVEHAVSLFDMTGFVKRDMEWEIPVEGQVLGYMDFDKDNNRATYRLALPAVPEGLLNDVDQDDISENGLQIFAVGYNPNLSGGVFSEGDDRSFGWPSYLASVKTDTENQYEVIGGKLVIWAADSEQQFPSGFGEDGLLFTQDDPRMDVPVGYSIVDLDTQPFELERDSVVVIALYEPEDVAVKDFSDLSYTEAFDSMFEIASKEYAFNGVEGKQPDWDAIYAQVAPKVAEAQKERDEYGFFLALREFSLSFNDGHVGLDGGDLQGYYNQNTILGGYGFAVRELDDGSVIVVYVLEEGPADLAGMKVGAELLKYNDKDVQTALSEVKQYSPQSTDFGLRYEQTNFLTRGSIGDTISVTFRNPGQNTQTVQLTSIYEVDSLLSVLGGGSHDDYALPAEYYYDSYYGIGYIRLNSNYDDLGLEIRIFERALQIFEDAGAIGIVIDLRHNGGGSSLGLAGFLYDEEIPLGQQEYYSDKTGQFEADGPRDKVYPKEEQYRFDNMVLLVDQFCYSACEIEAYGFSQVPGMVVMGQFPTAGVEAEISRGQYILPEDIEMTIPTGRFTLPDGSIFLEGQGVQPSVRLPVDEDSLLSEQDTVLEEAYRYILSQ